MCLSMSLIPLLWGAMVSFAMHMRFIMQVSWKSWSCSTASSCCLVSLGLGEGHKVGGCSTDSYILPGCCSDKGTDMCWRGPLSCSGWLLFSLLMQDIEMVGSCSGQFLLLKWTHCVWPVMCRGGIQKNVAIILWHLTVIFTMLVCTGCVQSLWSGGMWHSCVCLLSVSKRDSGCGAEFVL